MSTDDTLLTADDPGPTAPSRDETLGGRCIDDEQCDDGIECTFDACDMELERCRFTPDDSLCQDESYCNGREVCRPSHGCESGEAVACDDEAPCTLDRCDEATQSCVRTPRDIDADGDVDEHCQDFAADAGASDAPIVGADCNDQDPSISSLHAEVCDNTIDDNCNGEVDEGNCTDAIGDGCRSALRVTESSVLELEFNALSADVASVCGAMTTADAIVWLEPKQASSLFVRAVGESPDLMLSLQRTCSDVATETACAWGTLDSSGPFPRHNVAVLGAPEIAAEPIALRVAVSGYGAQPTELQIEFGQPVQVPSNDLCTTALPIILGEPMLADLRLARSDAMSSCATPRTSDGAVLDNGRRPFADLSYELVLDEAKDVTAFAASEDAASSPVLTLYAERCSADAELVCVQSDQSDLFARALPAGRYLLNVAADVPSVVQFVVSIAAASSAPDGDLCEQPLDATPWDTLLLDPKSMADDLTLECSNFGRDASYQFELEQASDVLLRARFSDGDRAAVGLSKTPSQSDACDTEGFTCSASTDGVARVVVHNLPKGTYPAAVESEQGNPLEALVATRPARAPIIVAAADNCDDALSVPNGGAYFTGNTKHAGFDYTASCDLAGASLSGTPDQWLSMLFDEPTHLILHSTGSEIPLLLNLRSGEACPGKELQRACLIAGDAATGTYFERTLPAGQYWLQLMGYAGSSGRWQLEIFSDTSK